MNYPVVIHKDKGSDYGVTVPDLPGCFSAGDTLDEALAMAREAIELHIEGLIEEGLPVPAPTAIEAHRLNRRFAGGAWGIVSIDRASLRARAKRINITMPERILDAVDRFARRQGETRSRVLARAVTEYMGRQGAEAPKKSRPRKKPAAARSSKRRRV